jgi:nitronate monooxygenase
VARHLGSGQGVGQIVDAPRVAELVERQKLEFAAASGVFMKRISAQAAKRH